MNSTPTNPYTKVNMTIAAHKLAGYSASRSPLDFYSTPSWATEALFMVETFNGSVLEPAAGDGAMVEVIKKFNHCVARDIQSGQDFLEYQGRFANVVTNPPFSLAEAFIEKAKQVATEKIALFLRLNFLEGQKRQRMFRDTEFPLARVHVFSKRVSLYAGEKGKNGGTMAFAWFVWDKEHKGLPTINWI